MPAPAHRPSDVEQRWLRSPHPDPRRSNRQRALVSILSAFAFRTIGCAFPDVFHAHARPLYLYHAAQVPSLLTMQGPIGSSGVQVVPNSAQSAGSALP